ncbi:MAG: uncharacterized protein A8A55_2850 [Amphiamblys sp. WSBS2006]|nr:MAG: uncharacterized protein A8A55_2850 [Amphiamblys sp. WSBS2006]
MSEKETDLEYHSMRKGTFYMTVQHLYFSYEAAGVERDVRAVIERILSVSGIERKYSVLCSGKESVFVSFTGEKRVFLEIKNTLLTADIFTKTTNFPLWDIVSDEKSICFLKRYIEGKFPRAVLFQEEIGHEDVFVSSLKKIPSIHITGKREEIAVIKADIFKQINRLKNTHTETVLVAKRSLFHVFGQRQKKISSVMAETATKIMALSSSMITRAGDRHGETPLYIAGKELGTVDAKSRIARLVSEGQEAKKVFPMKKEELDYVLERKKAFLERSLLFFGCCIVVGEDREALVEIHGPTPFCVGKIKERLEELCLHRIHGEMVFASPADRYYLETKLRTELRLQDCAFFFYVDSMCVEGTEEGVCAFLKEATEVLKERLPEIKVSVERSSGEREFLCGKKDGKIWRIAKETCAEIRIKDDYSREKWKMEICGTIARVGRCFELMRREFVAQKSFHVSTLFHKELIGTNGKTIQRLIKEYSVYTKFLDAREERALFGTQEDLLLGDNIPVHNVVVKTPHKNRESLRLMQEEIMELIERARDIVVKKQITVRQGFFQELHPAITNTNSRAEVLLRPFGGEDADLLVTGKRADVDEVCREIASMKRAKNTGAKELAIDTTLARLNLRILARLERPTDTRIEVSHPFEMDKEGLFLGKEAEDRAAGTGKEGNTLAKSFQYSEETMRRDMMDRFLDLTVEFAWDNKKRPACLFEK